MENQRLIRWRDATHSTLMTAFSRYLRAALAASLLSSALPACGGSSSETPPPLEPSPREMLPHAGSSPNAGGAHGSPRHRAGDAGLF
jgi:hypothetical protein